MGKKVDVISTGYWMFALVVTWVPLLNLVAIPILALFSSHPSKRNFYRAHLMFFLMLVLIFLVVAIASYGSNFVPAIREKFEMLGNTPSEIELSNPDSSL